ncbi:MAG: hypothetical protein EXS16_10450 [Gemmataceae bacterium]|nr:hypothetical protein [Gemmataceae bacterium]
MLFEDPKPATQDEFAAMMTRAILEEGETQPLEYDREQFCLIVAGDNANLLNLGNAYNEFCAVDAELRESVVARFVRVWFARNRDVPDVFAEASLRLLPAIRNRSYFELTKLQIANRGMATPDWPLQILAKHFPVCLVYDLPDSIHQIQQSTLDKWQIGFDEVMVKATANLRAMTDQPLESIIPGVWQSAWRDNHDIARVILTDFIRQHDVQGDPVVLLPNRDTLLLTGSDDEAGLGAIAALAEEALQSPRPMNGMALRLAGDAWVPFLPSAEHPEFARYQLLWIRSVGQDYEEQKELLNEANEKSDNDVFVAGFKARQNNETGEIVSYCVWSKGIVMLLPQTDEVFFYVGQGEDKGDIIARATWADIIAVAGDLMKPDGSYPERFRVEAFPSDAQLMELQSREKA